MSQAIEYELCCSRCGYNLYLAGFGEGCPECGGLNLLSALDAVERADRMMAGSFRGDVLVDLMHRVEAIKLVWHAYLFACEAQRAPADPPIVPGNAMISPVTWCKALRDDAVLQWGGQAVTLLKSLGIHHSEHVGVIVMGLERVGMLRHGMEIELAHFIGCCAYDDLPTSLV